MTISIYKVFASPILKPPAIEPNLYNYRFRSVASSHISHTSLKSHIRPVAIQRKPSICALNLPDAVTKNNTEVLVELDDIPGPPDGGWGWVICLACFMGNFVGDGIAYTFGVLIKPLAEVISNSAT